VSDSVVIYGINYAPEIAGVGKFTGEIGQHLAAEGRRVTVITAPPHYPGWRVGDGHDASAWRTEREGSTTIYRCPLYLHPEMRGLRRLIAPLSFALSSAPVALWQILRLRPDVVIAVEPTLFSAPIARLAAKLAGAKAVLHVQDLEVDAAFAMGHLGGGLLGRLGRAWERRVLTGFDRVITISGKMAERLQAKGVNPERLAVVRNWVDLELITPRPVSQAYRRELGLKPEDFVVLYSGNLGAKQGVGLLAAAAERLADDPDVVFAIAGDGPMRGKLAAMAAELPNLKLLDFQPEARFGEFLSIADVHVLPQERDAADLLLPSKLGGMLASGRPVIVTADPHTELGEFLAGACELTPPGDAVALSLALRQAKAARPSPAREAKRLALAQSLAKDAGLAAFTAAALFLQGPARSDQPARAAA